MKRRTRHLGSAFVLLEAMLAVAIFAIGVIALARCVENCLQAQTYLKDDDRARRVLNNRMMEIEVGSVALKDATTTEELKEPYAGMTLKTFKTPIERKNEKDQEILGLYHIKLELRWQSAGQEQLRSLEFYVYPGQ